MREYSNRDTGDISNNYTGLKIGYLLPLPPEKSGLVNQIELVKAVRKHLGASPTVFTFTEQPDRQQEIPTVTIRKSIFAPFKITKECKSRNISVFHAHYYFGIFGIGSSSVTRFSTSAFFVLFLGILLRIVGIKFIITLHSVITDIGEESVLKEMREKRYLNPIIHAFQRLLVTVSNVTLVFSDSQIVALSSHVRSNKLKSIPLGYRNLNITAEPHPKFTYVYFGFIRRNKGLLTLLNAFGELYVKYPDTKLLIIAHRDLDKIQLNDDYYDTVYEKIEDLIKTADISFENRWMEWEGVRSVISHSDAIVLPYSDNANEISGVVADLGNSGLPIICSDIQRFKNMLCDKTDALFYRNEDTKDLMDKMEIIYLDSNLKFSLSKGIKQTSEKFSWEKVAELHYREYLHLQNMKNKTRNKICRNS